MNDLLYLLSCAVNASAPDAERLRSMDLDALYRTASRHMVTAAAAMALERAGITDHRFTQAKGKAIRKSAAMDMEMQLLFARLEAAGIWYMPLKGTVIKALYPAFGMRQMSDHDILFDAVYAGKVRDILEQLGFTAEHYGTGNHDVYFKQPVCNFEMHRALFGENHNEKLYTYYRDPMRLMHRDVDNAYGYHFSDEDFYVYMTAHEYKHYSGSGTGIRSLLDCYVFVKEKGGSLDWVYIREQTAQLGIADFEQERRELAMKLFSGESAPKLTDREQEMLGYYAGSGTYGTLENSIRMKLKDQTKLSFWMHSIFISRKQMAQSVRFTKISPILYPAGVVWRCGRVLIFRRDGLKRTIKAVRKYGK